MTIPVLSTAPQTRPSAPAADPFPADLVGRDEELADLLGLLADGTCGGVLLCGGPGLGKTRLAAAAAAQHARRTGAATAVLDAARHPDPAAEAERLLPALTPGGLLVIDGLDLTDHRALLAVPAAARVTVLATARRPLTTALHRYSLAPLPVPLDCSALDLDGLARVPSVLLYTACLRALHPGFALRRDNHRAVARTVAELRGIPGELCGAARIAALEGPEVLDAADDPAHRLLHAYTPGRPAAGDGLTPEQLRLLAAARLFAGGFGPEALRAVADVPLPRFPAALETLLEAHLLALSGLPSGRLGGFTRVRLHVPFGAPPPADAPGFDPGAARLAHARYYEGLTRDAARALHAGDQAAALTAFRAEERNIRAALETRLTDGEPARALDLAEQARTHFDALGTPFPWADRLAAAPAPAAEADRARLCLLLAEAAVRAGEPENALALLDRVTGPAARLDRVRGLATLPHRPAEGIALLRRALAAYRAGDDEPAASRTALETSLAEFLDGRTAEATALAGDVLPSALARHDILTVGTALLHLSVYASAEGRRTVADGYYERAMAHLRTLGAPAVLGAFTTILGSPLRPGVTARATAVARLLGSFHAARPGLFGEPADPDFTVARAERHLRGLLDERDFLAALRDGAATPLPTLLHDFAAPPADPPPATLDSRPAGPLTPRQTQVSLLIADGLSNKQIARRLAISEWTVVNHIRETMKKLGCTSRVEIAGWILAGTATGTGRG
ncbi:LuxR C-terminal-related transcriptional regulator [Streptomyces capparidis]